MSLFELEHTDAERQVLMALSSGVSPLEIPDFVGMDVAEVEEVFDQQGQRRPAGFARSVGQRLQGRAAALAASLSGLAQQV